MNIKTLGMLGAAALALAACSPKAEEPKAEPSTSMGEMKMGDAKTDAATVPAGPITSTGKVTAIDAAAGTVTLDHQAIPAVGWDAMTMEFTAADPVILKDLKVGDAVSFELKSAAEKTVVSKIQKQ